MVSQYEVQNFYHNVSVLKKRGVDSNVWTALVRAEEIALGKKVYKQVLYSNSELRMDSVSLALNAFRKTYDLSSKFHLFEHYHCDPEFFMRIVSTV